MIHYKKIATIACLLFACLVLSAQNGIDWKIAELPHLQRTEGNPETFETPLGKAVQFNGSDAYFLDHHPLKGLSQFTLEVIFRPDGDGRFEQRFLHIGTVSSQRLMLETRVKRDGTWYFDTHFHLPNDFKLTLIDSTLTHPTDCWYHAAVVVDGTRAKVFINGVMEFDEHLEYLPLSESDVTSIGVRQNLRSWYKGGFYRMRITPHPLPVSEFLNDHHALNDNQ